MWEPDGFEVIIQGYRFYVEPINLIGHYPNGVRKTYGIVGHGRHVEANTRAPQSLYDEIARSLDLLEQVTDYGDMSVAEFLAKLLPD